MRTASDGATNRTSAICLVSTVSGAEVRPEAEGIRPADRPDDAFRQVDGVEDLPVPAGRGRYRSHWVPAGLERGSVQSP